MKRVVEGWASKLQVAALLCVSLSPVAPVSAEGWCNLPSGWRVRTNGNNSDTVWIYGVFEGQPTWRWIRLNDPQAGTGAPNIALALAAQVAGKRISVYLDLPQDTCATLPVWSEAIRHVEMLDWSCVVLGSGASWRGDAV